MTKKLPPDVKQARKPTRVACAFCHSKHLQCDHSRPCKNCVKRGLAETCVDAVRRKKKADTTAGTAPKRKRITKQTAVTSPKQISIKTDTHKDQSETISGAKVTNTAQNKVVNTNSTQKQTQPNTHTPAVSTPTGQVNKPTTPHNGNTAKTKQTNPEINNNSPPSTTTKSPRKRTRTATSTSSTPVPAPETPQLTLSKKQRGKKLQKLNNGSSNSDEGANVEEYDEDNNDDDDDDNDDDDDDDDDIDDSARPMHPSIHSTADLAGLGVITPSTSNILPPPISLLNLANVSLSNMNIPQMAHTQSQQSANGLLASIKPDPSLSDLRLPSFSDLKNFSSLQGDVRTPQFDMKIPSFSPDLKQSPNPNNTGSIPTSQTLSMMGLPSLSTTGLQNLLNATASAKQLDLDKATLQPPSKIIASKNNSNNNSNNHSRSNSTNPANNILSMVHDPSHSIDPETPGSPLEFSVSSVSRTENIPLSATHSLNQSLDPRFSQDILSSESSMRNFESAMANDEYAQLTDLLNTNPPTPTMGYLDSKRKKIDMMAATMSSVGGSKLKKLRSRHLPRSPELENEHIFVKGISPTDSEQDDDDDSRPYISINLEDGSMISSYPNNSTPNSFVYNIDHSQMPNTAKEIPKDFEQADDYTSPLIMRHVIKQPDDIYLTSIVKAYQYPKAYHALIAYLKKRFNKRQLLEIAKCMAKYRPSFISATKSLYENDLIFTERSFQRTLLEYENLISMSPSPTIIWRRTGEIVALTNEFAVMTGYSRMSLLSKRTFIVELMDDESTINYFRSFSEFAFGDLNATYLTDCNLRKAEDNNYLRCCCVWTIKRDVFDIPMLIVGQFLPVLE